MRIFTIAIAACAFLAAPAVSASDRRAVAEDINMAIGSAFSVIADRQNAINSSTLAPSRFDIDALIAEMRANYRERAGQSFDAPTPADGRRFRIALNAAVREVLQDFQPFIIEGGQDAFVPAFFRAQFLVVASERMGDSMDAVATNREADLINFDSSVESVFEHNATANHVRTLVTRGHREVDHRVVGDRLVSYFPMTLKESCVACHARSGLEQEVGGFGGALVISTIGR